MTRHFSPSRFLFFCTAVVVCVPVLAGTSGCGGSGRHGYETGDKYVTARCTDGTRTTSTTPDISCAAHGGIDQRYDRPQ